MTIIKRIIFRIIIIRRKVLHLWSIFFDHQYYPHFTCTFTIFCFDAHYQHHLGYIKTSASGERSSTCAGTCLTSSPKDHWRMKRSLFLCSTLNTIYSYLLLAFWHHFQLGVQQNNIIKREVLNLGCNNIIFWFDAWLVINFIITIEISLLQFSCEKSSHWVVQCFL